MVRDLGGVLLMVVSIGSCFVRDAKGINSQDAAIIREDASTSMEAKRLPEPGARFMHSIPNPISWAEMERYRRYLGLSDDQVIFLRYIYDEYVTTWNELVDKKWSEVDRLNAAAVLNVSNGLRGWDLAETFNAHVDAEIKFREVMIPNEEELFAKMEAVLTEAQREAMWRVRADRDRQRTNPRLCRIRTAWLEFSSYVQGELGLSADELANVDPVLLEYERETSELRRRIGDLLLANRKECYRLQTEILFGPRDGINDAKVRKNANDARDNIRGEEAKLQVELAMIQEKYLPKIAEKLPGAKAETFVRRQQEMVWPEVYPDSTSPAEAYKSVMTSGRLEREQRIYLEGLWRANRKRYDHVCSEMCERVDRSNESMARTDSPGNQAEYRESMQRWREQRWELNLQMLGALEEVVSPEDTASRRLIKQPIGMIETYKKWEKGGGQPVGGPKGGG